MVRAASVPPRVLILSWEYPPIVEGGLARHVRKLSEQLVEQGAEVHVLTRGDRFRLPGEPLVSRARLRRRYALTQEDRHGVIVHRVREPDFPKDDLDAFISWVDHMNDDMRAAGAELAVGCTYKYLNGGPGSPAFVYVAQRLLGEITQPVQGWLGATDPFLMGPTYTPAEGIRRFQSGTPPILGLLPMRDMLDLIEEVGIGAVREKSIALTSYAVTLADELLSPLGVEVASPRDPALRGGHVTLHHLAMRGVTERLWERDVIPDYRDPGGLRIGLSPLSTSFAEVESGMTAVREELSTIA